MSTPISEVEKKIAEKIQMNRLKKQQKRKEIVRAAAIVLVILCTSSMLLFSKPVSAFKEDLIQTFTKMGGNIHILMGNSKQSPPRGEMEKTVASVQKEVSFTILTPQFIPEGFEFKGISKSPGHEDEMVILTFVSDDSEILFSQTKVSDNFSYSININENQGKSEQVQIGRHIGNMLIFKDGSCSLTWLTDDYILCEISGSISTEQLREFASSL